MLGNQIRKLRESQRLTQDAIANELGVTKQTVSNWENDNSPPSVDMLKKIALFFHCSTDYLLEINSSQIIDVSDLKPSQIAHLQMIIDDFVNNNVR